MVFEDFKTLRTTNICKFLKNKYFKFVQNGGKVGFLSKFDISFAVIIVKYYLKNKNFPRFSGF